MPNRCLTPPEVAGLNELQDVTVAALRFLADDDAELLFALRRRFYTRLMHLERGTPMHRTKVKRVKWKAQEGRCAICGKAMDQKGSELDRAKASDGYTVREHSARASRVPRRGPSREGLQRRRSTDSDPH